jgi:16S rRNA (guanine966-N2)-methyltransferase
MKDRVREAVFNLLGPGIRGTHAVDLFAGTGALGLEALSRGASSVTFVEQHYPTAGIIRENIATLGVEDRSRVIAANVFVWAARHDLPRGAAWSVFCSPPYAFFVERTEAMLDLIGRMMEDSPGGSMLVVESDDRFRFEQLPQPDAWDVRRYPPAVVGIWRRPAEERPLE